MALPLCRTPMVVGFATLSYYTFYTNPRGQPYRGKIEPCYGPATLGNTQKKKVKNRRSISSERYPL